MLNQEDLYKLIIKEQWKDILNLLYSNKTIIKTDPLLGQAAIVFEQEFFSRIKNYEITRKDILDNLDTLFILNHGRFYEVSTENYKTLILEIVKRKPLIEAYDYAKLFPNEDICIKTINKFKESNLKENIPIIPSITSMNWIEIYNRLFELINQQGDAATYFSGPRFINTVKEFDPYFLDYNQYINQRNHEGKSTSRKIFYYDILIELKEELRLKVINRILEILKPFQNHKVEIIQDLLGHKVTPKETVVNNLKKEEYLNNPIVFISYSWDNEPHKKWVLNLANRLCLDGIEVILDRYNLKPGKNLPHFVETSIGKANRIIIVYTPNYKLKADKRTGGVGYEYSIMNAELYKNQTTNEKIIPVLRNGNIEESVPTFMQQFIHIDIRNDENYENSYIDLIREIYNEPAIQKPTLGVKPTFEKYKSESVEKHLIGNNPNLNIDANKVISSDFNNDLLITPKKELNDIPNWKASTNYSTPQWADYLKIPIKNKYIKRLKCQIISPSEYYRFGFKLKRINGKIFGDGSIQSLDNNLVIHIGKNLSSDELFVTTYRNGIRARPDKYTDEKPSVNIFTLELLIDEENILHLYLNDKEVHKLLINIEIREQIYMIAWGDGNEYELSVENIEYESVNG